MSSQEYYLVKGDKHDFEYVLPNCFPKSPSGLFSSSLFYKVWFAPLPNKHLLSPFVAGLVRRKWPWGEVLMYK